MAVLMVAWANPAAADLYRWVDPETGSVKFSSYPPPWFGNAQAERRAPKVEVIPAMQSAPAFEPAPRTDGESSARPAERKETVDYATSLELAKERARAGAGTDAQRSDPRDALLKLLAQRVAALVAAAPDAAERAYMEFFEPLQELERLERQSKAPNPREDAVRVEEKLKLAAPLESHRLAQTQQLAASRPPAAGAAPEAIASAWRATQLQLAALEWTNEALKAVDPRRVNARHFEMRALAEKLAATWQPYVDAGRRDRGR